MFVNEHYLTLLMRPAVGSADRTGLLLKRFAKAKAAEEEVDNAELARFEEKVRDIEKLPRRCSPARLALYEHNGLLFSAPKTGTAQRRDRLRHYVSPLGEAVRYKKT